MNIAKKLEETVRITFDYKGEKVWADLYSNMITMRFVQNGVDFYTQKNFLGIAESLSKGIKAWSLYYQAEGKKKEEFPPSFENLSEVVDREFITALMAAIQEVFMGKPEIDEESEISSAVSAQ